MSTSDDTHTLDGTWSESSAFRQNTGYQKVRLWPFTGGGPQPPSNLATHHAQSPDDSQTNAALN